MLNKVKREVTTADAMENRLIPVQMSRDKEKAAPAIWRKPSVVPTSPMRWCDFSSIVADLCIRISEYKSPRKTLDGATAAGFSY